MNGSGGNTVVRCDLRGRAIITKYGNTLTVCQAGFGVPRPIPVTPVRATVSDVVFVGIPSEISQPAVGGDSVVVASLHAFGTIPDEGPKYQLMDTACLSDTVSVQADAKIAIGAYYRHPSSAAVNADAFVTPSVCLSDRSCQRSYVAKIADFIKVFVPNNRFPNFHSKGVQ